MLTTTAVVPNPTIARPSVGKTQWMEGKDVQAKTNIPAVTPKKPPMMEA